MQLYRCYCLTISEILDVGVRAEPDVIRKIPAVVVRILIDYDLVGIPEPVTAEAEIGRGNTKIEAAEPETTRASSADPPHVAATEASGKPTVFERMIQMIMGVIAASIVADPTITLDVNVGSGGMASPIRRMAFDWRCRMRRGLVSSGAVSGDMSATNLGLGFMLRENRS
jgi:hypothetical protein